MSNVSSIFVGDVCLKMAELKERGFQEDANESILGLDKEVLDMHSLKILSRKVRLKEALLNPPTIEECSSRQLMDAESFCEVSKRRI